MAGISDFLFNGSPPPNITTGASQSTSYPQWWQDYAQGILAKANTVAAQPYTPYPAPLQAPFTQAQQQSFDLTGQNVGSWRPDIAQAQGALGQAATPFDQNTFNQFLSPYTTGVVNRIAQLGTQNMAENLLPAVNSTFTSSGQFGSDRNAVFNNQALRDTNQNILGQQAYALQGAQDAAMNAYNAAENRTGQAGQQLGALGQAVQGAGLTDAAALNTVGGQQQSQTQGGLDIAYQQFLNQLNWPFNMTNFMSRTLAGQPAPATQTTGTSSGPGSVFGPSGLSTLAGALSLGNSLASPNSGIGNAIGSGLGALGQGIGNVASGIGNFFDNIFREGGRVHPRYAGGGMSRARSPRMGGQGIAIPRPASGLTPPLSARRMPNLLPPLRMMAAA